jgi:hypothetical protein
MILPGTETKQPWSRREAFGTAEPPMLISPFSPAALPPS